MNQSIVHIALVVRDYDEAIQFYTHVLNFELIEDTYQPEQDKRWVVVAPAGSKGTTILLARASNQEQEAFIGNQSGGRVFLFLNTDDFWRDYHAMCQNGVVFVREPKEAEYGTVAVFKDLYGNLWDLLQLKSDVTIRNATADDAKAICEIYNPIVLNSTVSFEVEPVSEHEMQERIVAIQNKYPYLVILKGTELIGYAYASTWRSRDAYRFCVETTIYMREDARGKGLAHQLYTSLLHELKHRGFTQAIAGIGGDNPASERFHQKLGFEFVGKFESVGYKFDQWLSATFYQCTL